VAPPFSGDADLEIIESWKLNAEPWTAAVRRRSIESRRLVTDRAIVEAVLEQKPASVLDLGCGEGWLARTLADHGIRVHGVDVVPELIERARAAGAGEFTVMSYEEIAAGGLAVTADVVVCNFALFGDAVVAALFRSVPSLLRGNGVFIVQTLHPHSACGDQPYRTGWREGSWSGFDAAFTRPAPWYFRTLESWVLLFAGNGLAVRDMREPLHPATLKPASVIFIAARQ